MSQQKGFKRAEKVAKRKRKLETVARKRAINKAIYQLSKKHAGHDHEGHEGHEGHAHD